VKRRRSKRIAQPGETRKWYRTEQPSQENIQEIEQTEQPYRKILRKIHNHHLKALQNSSSKVMR
jgi:hypothetical protein